MFEGGWIASLSNGETVFQNDKPEEMSSWQKLRLRCDEEKIHVTMLRLQRNGVTLIGIPNARGYMQCYEMRKSVQTEHEYTRQGLGSVLGEHIVMCWIDDSNNVAQGVYALKDYLPHAVLKE